MLTLMLQSILYLHVVMCVTYKQENARYEKQPVENATYGSYMDDYSGRSIFECMSICTENRECQSVLYEVNNKTCKTNLDVISSSAPEGTCGSTVQTCPYIYARKFVQPCEKDQTCTGEADCDVNRNLTCLASGLTSRKCACKEGYSFRQGSCDCVTDCRTYGDTFEVLNDKFIEGYVTKKVVRAPDVGSCKRVCREEIGFICKSAQMSNKRDATCILRDVTVTMVKDREEFHDLTGVNVYVRECA